MASPGPAAPLHLRALTISDEPEARQAHEELARDDFGFLLDEQPGEAWPDYVARLEHVRQGRGLAPGRVPATFLVAEVEGRIVGRASVRHELNAWLAEVGGHIGYGVRPGARRRGHATEILRQALRVARAVGIEEALVICDGGNLASAATIEACGGRFERLVPAHGDEPPTRRYRVVTG